MTYADIIIKSTNIFTSETLETIPGAVVICGQTIEAVCSAEEAEDYKGENTQIIDAGENLVLPGFNDCHTHFMQNGIVKDSEYTLSLEGVGTRAEVIEAINKFAAAHPENKWVMGCDLNFESWPAEEKLTRELLDELVPDRPAYFATWDMHTGWFNSLAMEAAGYTDGMEDPEGGYLGRYDDGRLNGLGYEPPANDPVWGLGNLAADMDRALGNSIQECLEFGVTSVGLVFPYGGVEENAHMQVFKDFEAEGKLPIRVSIWPKMAKGMDAAKRYERELTSDYLRFAGVKQLTDGISEAHTAYQTEPYADDPEAGCGVPTLPYEELLPLVREASRNNYPVRLHCIGNGAVKQALDAFEQVAKEQGNKGLRHAIEHIETCRPEDVERFAKLGVVASMQPIHAVLNVDGYPTLFDPKWQKMMWPIKSLMDAGAIVAFATDAPVWNFNPMEGLYAAIERKQPWDAYPEGGFVPGQRIDLARAIQAYTYGGAYVSNFEHRVGTLHAGKLADVVVMDRNLFDCTPEQLLEAKPLCTIVGGKVAYEAPTAE